MQSLRNEEEAQKKVVAETTAATPQILYTRDLDAFMAALEDYEEREAKQLRALEERQKRAGAKGKSKQVCGGSNDRYTSADIDEL